MRAGGGEGNLSLVGKIGVALLKEQHGLTGQPGPTLPGPRIDGIV